MTEQPIDVSPAETLRRLQAAEVLLVDVREQGEWDHSHIDGDVRHVPLSRLQGEASSIGRDRPVIFQCRVGGRSTMAAQAFRTAGYEAYSLDGGLLAWHAEGLPITPAGAGVADH